MRWNTDYLQNHHLRSLLQIHAVRGRLHEGGDTPDGQGRG